MDEELLRHALRQQGTTFPYKSAFLEDPQELFRRLRDQCTARLVVAPHARFRYPRSASTTTYLQMDLGNYHVCDALPDHFTEDARVRSRVRERWSPMENWEWYRDGRDLGRLLEAAQRGLAANPYGAEIARARGRLHTFLLREAIYELSFECTQFKVSLAKATLAFCLELAGGTRRRVLDPCLGWGDRLLAACALDVDAYVATDPNPAVHVWSSPETLRRLPEIESLVRSGRVATVRTPFEDFDVSPESFDVVFTSPPFFDYEQYGDDEDALNGQSVRSFPTLDRWVHEWLVPCVVRMHDVALRPGGVLALHLKDTSSGAYCATLVETLARKHRIWLHGTVVARRGWCGSECPIWIWRKPLV